MFESLGVNYMGNNHQLISNKYSTYNIQAETSDTIPVLKKPNEKRTELTRADQGFWVPGIQGFFKIRLQYSSIFHPK